MKRQTIIEIICFLFILLFVYAATSKLLDYGKFELELGKSPILTLFSSWIAWSIPCIEICISILLVMQKTRLVALYTSFSLMVIFSAYIVAITNFSDYVPCSCGGVLQNMNWDQHLVFNLAFVFLGAIAILVFPPININNHDKNSFAQNRGS